MYRGVINLDFTGQYSNGYQKLISALIQLGWTYTETSALVLEDATFSTAMRSLDVVARGATGAGTLSAVTIQLQLISAAKNYVATKNHPNALSDIQGNSLP